MIGVAIDAAPPGELADAIAPGGPLPVVRPLFGQWRNGRAEIDELFDGYGLLSGAGVGRRAVDHVTAPASTPYDRQMCSK